MTNFQFVKANQLRANIVNTLVWYSIAVLSGLYQVLQHTPSNLSGTQLNNSDFYCETVPCNVSLLVDQSYANYFQSFKCSGSITENRRWWKQVKRLGKIRLRLQVLQVFFPTCSIGQNSICKTDKNYIDGFEKVWVFNILILEYKAIRKSNHQCALITLLFGV